MFLSDVTDRGTIPAIVSTLTFNESRLRMIAENVANSMTPNYRTKQLDVAGFQRSLRSALEDRARRPERPFRIENGDEVRTESDGTLRVTPTVLPVENIVSHDGTNVSIERQMADLAETGMTHDLATALLTLKMDGLRKAIRGSSL